MDYFLYHHKVKGNDFPFYIGIGKINNSNSTRRKYHRAFSKTGRNKHWINLTNKHEYEIIIIKEFETLNEALCEETKLIDHYGRIMNNTGCLVNMIRENSEFDYHRSLGREKMIKKMQKPIHKYSLSGDYIESYKSMSIATRAYNGRSADLSYTVLGHRVSCFGFRWSYVKLQKLEKFVPIRRKKRIYQFSLDGEFIKEWNSSADIKRELGFKSSGIRNCLINTSNSSNGYIWSNSKNIENKIKDPYKICITDTISGESKRYRSYHQAELDLGIPINAISVFIRRGKYKYKHYKFEIYDCHCVKTADEKYAKKNNQQ